MLDQLHDRKLQVSLCNLFHWSPTLNSFVRNRLSSAPKLTPALTDTATIVSTTVNDKQMRVITVYLDKNSVNDVFIDGRSGVNVITKDERLRLGLAGPAPSLHLI